MTDVLEAGREEEQVETAGSPNHHHAVPLSALPHLEALFSGSTPQPKGTEPFGTPMPPSFLSPPSSPFSSFSFSLPPFSLPPSLIPSFHPSFFPPFFPSLVHSFPLPSLSLSTRELLSVGIPDGCLRQLQISVSAFQ